MHGTHDAAHIHQPPQSTQDIQLRQVTGVLARRPRDGAPEKESDASGKRKRVPFWQR